MFTSQLVINGNATGGIHTVTGALSDEVPLELGERAPEDMTVRRQPTRNRAPVPVEPSDRVEVRRHALRAAVLALLLFCTAIYRSMVAFDTFPAVEQKYDLAETRFILPRFSTEASN